MAKQELLATIRDRYQASSRKDKSRILDEFITGKPALHPFATFHLSTISASELAQSSLHVSTYP